MVGQSIVVYVLGTSYISGPRIAPQIHNELFWTTVIPLASYQLCKGMNCIYGFIVICIFFQPKQEDTPKYLEKEINSSLQKCRVNTIEEVL